MSGNISAPMMNDGVYERLQRAAEQADIPVLRLAEEAGLARATLYGLKFRGPKGGVSTTRTLNAVSIVLAKRLGKQPSEVYAYLTGLEEVDLAAAS